MNFISDGEKKKKTDTNEKWSLDAPTFQCPKSSRMCVLERAPITNCCALCSAKFFDTEMYNQHLKSCVYKGLQGGVTTRSERRKEEEKEKGKGKEKDEEKEEEKEEEKGKEKEKRKEKEQEAVEKEDEEERRTDKKEKKKKK